MKKLMVLVAALAMITGSAYAAEWNFYGNARIATFVVDNDNPGGVNDDTDYTQSLQSNSRIGANIKVSDELTGRFEYGTGVNVRLLYGTWNFGAGAFTVGQIWTPVNQFQSNQVYAGDNGLGGWGAAYAGRQPALQLTFGGLNIAALSTFSPAVVAGADNDVSLPRLEASYAYKFDMGSVKLIAGYQTFEVNTATYSADIDSYILGADGSVKFGAFTLGAGGWFGQNIGTYSSWGNGVMVDTSTGVDGMPVVSALGNVTDNDAFGFFVTAGFKVNDGLMFEAGYGFAQTELDVAGAQDDEVESYYLQSTIGLAPGVFFVPEIGVVDYKDNAAGVDETEVLYYGVKWQINF